MRPDDLPHIKDLPLFSEMEEERFAQLVEGAFLQNFPPGVELFSEGEPADFLYVVTEGHVELYASANNRETVIGILEPVTAFILAAAVSDAPYLMSARTLDKSRLLMIPASKFREMTGSDSQLTTAVLRELAKGYRTLVKAHKEMKLRTALERVANYLLRENKRQGSAGHFVLQHDKRILAALLGMTPENLSRAFGSLQEYGVTVEGTRITLSKLKDLETLAKPTTLIDDPDY
ncbi:cyclic nucleotide-binding domain-containing protein [Tepidicaulis sp. LMO-SS28]|uniref:cyclic nucleotide-binding domain-containing protein n=1 Tax=Tepidicaulis sp. LMO-SS28 TaxID=3447455 RepID=UPI003EE1ECC1